MTEWASIAQIPENWRTPFVSWAQNELVQTRARISFEDRYDPDQIWEVQLEYVRNKISPSSDEWLARLASVPMVRYEVEDQKISPIIWQHIEYGDLHWESSSFSSGRHPNSVKDNLVGIEFNTAEAARLGLVVDRVAAKVANASSNRGRKLASAWYPWVAYLVLVSSDLSGQDGPDTLYDKVADRMAADGLDPPPRSTVQPAAREVIRLLRRENL